VTGPSLYQRVMGDRFELLPPAVQRFHRLAGRVVLHGRVRTDAPTSWLASVIAVVLGTPRRATEGVLRFELDAGPDLERWTRHFPLRTMSSRLCARAGRVEEQLGPVRLTFDLIAGSESLRMRLVHLRVLGLPWPRWLMPQITAEESGRDDRLQFSVVAELPWAGTVASYRGHLILHGRSIA